MCKNIHEIYKTQNPIGRENKKGSDLKKLKVSFLLIIYMYKKNRNGLYKLSHLMDKGR